MGQYSGAKGQNSNEELAAMQNTLVQSQRLAFAGKIGRWHCPRNQQSFRWNFGVKFPGIRGLKDDDPHRENFAGSDQTNNALSDIVKGLLQFSRPEEGKTEYVKINDVLNSTLSLIEKQALFLNIEVIKILTRHCQTCWEIALNCNKYLSILL